MKVTQWSEVRAALDLATCMWLDLDGFHLTGAPENPPLTSIMWAWRQAGQGTTAYRPRLDGGVTFLATLAVRAGDGDELCAWGDRGQVAAAKDHAAATGVPDPTTLQLRYAVDAPDGSVPIPFYWQQES